MEKNSNMDFFLVVLEERGKEKEMKKGVLLFISNTLIFRKSLCTGMI